MDWTRVITQAKERRGLTQSQLAALAGCSQFCISHLESGKTRDPRYSIGAKLIELAGIELDAHNGTVAAPANPDTGATEDGQGE